MRIKSFAKFALAALCLASLSLASCNKNDEPQKDEFYIRASISNSLIFFNEQGIWDGFNKKEDVVLYPAINKYYEFSELSKLQFYFSHFYEGYTYGFTPSENGDTKDYPGEMFNHQFSVITGGAPAESDVDNSSAVNPFIVGNWDAYAESSISSWKQRTCLITLKLRSFDGSYLSTNFRPQSMKVTNTCYTYYSMLNGDGFAKKFQKGDYLKLIVHGVLENGPEKTIEFYLADCRGNDSSKWFVKDWATINLTSLGLVDGVYFTMESSDNSDYGMNTPAYFGLCDFEIVNNFFQLDL